MRVIHVLRKPLSEPNLGRNMQRWETGGLNIDAARIPTNGEVVTTHTQGVEAASAEVKVYGKFAGGFTTHQTAGQAIGRWPANLLLKHLPSCTEAACTAGCPAERLDQQSGTTTSSGGRIGNAEGAYTNQGSTGWSGKHEKGDPGFGDRGGASRYFKQLRG